MRNPGGYNSPLRYAVALELLEHSRYLKISTSTPFSPADLEVATAAVYALRQEPEKMFEWLEHAWTTHDGDVTDLR